MNSSTSSTVRSQAGIGRIVIIVLLAVIVAAGLVGYKIHATRSDVSSNTASQSSTDPVAIKSVPINTTSDIDATIATLDQNDPVTTSSDDFTAFNNQIQTLQ